MKIAIARFFIGFSIACLVGSHTLAQESAAPTPQSNKDEVDFEFKCLSDKVQLDPAVQPIGNVVFPREANTPPLPLEPPLEVRKAREHGTVVVGVLVTEKGRVAKARVFQSTATPRLNELSLQAAHNWRFVAGKVDGKKACLWRSVTLTYFDPKNPPRIPTL